MPIVFVHGVSNRPGKDNDESRAERQKFLAQTVARSALKNPKALILQPFWGDLIPAFSGKSPIVPPVNPEGKFEAFGSGARALPLEAFGASSEMLPLVLGAGVLPENRRLTAIAKRSFGEAIDLLWQEGMQVSEVKGHATEETELLAGGVVASNYASKNPEPEWVENVATDDEFLKKLAEELERWSKPVAPAAVGQVGGVSLEAFGVSDRVWSWLKKGVAKIQQKVVDIPNDALLNAFRPAISQGLVNFFGDVFFYQTYRGTKESPGDIVTRVANDLRKAKQQAPDEDLVVIGHSMGGNILYDILTHYDTGIKVDVLVTVGCQASVFKQLGIFKEQDGKPDPAKKLPKPQSVERWLNIFDPQDILSFAFTPEFSDVSDFYFESPGGVLGAHGEYFKRIRFYERLVARILEA